MDTAFGLYLPEYTIPAPAPQTKFVKIIGRDGSVDLSDAIGLHYDSRSWSLDFKCFDPTVNWHTLTSAVMNAIHGKRLNFEFDDDPDYFWTGRISVSSYVSTRGTGTLKVNITSDPFKYAKLSTIVTKTASTGTEYTGSVVTFNNGLIYDLSADIEPIQQGTGDPSPSNIRPISGLTGLSVYVSPTQDPDDATVYNVDWSTQAGTVYGGTLDVVTGVLTVDKAIVDLGSINWTYESGYAYPYFIGTMPNDCVVGSTVQGQISVLCSIYESIQNIGASEFRTADHNCQCCLNSNVSTRRLLVQNSAYTDAATFKTAMNGVKLVYDLETPLTYQLTPQEIEALVGTNNIWTSSGDVSVTVVTPETVTNNGLPAVPTVTASADMDLRWGNYSASVQQGTSTIPQLVLETGDNHIFIIGTGNISFEWSEASL